MSIKFESKWLNHDFQMNKSITSLVSSNFLTDFTLVSEKRSINVHRLILCAASSYFMKFFSSFSSLRENDLMIPTELTFYDVSFKDLYNIIQFIYTGHIKLDHDDMISFHNAGSKLGVDGIIGMAIDIVKEENQQQQQRAKKRSFEDASTTPIPKKLRRVGFYNDDSNDDDRSSDDYDIFHYSCSYCQKNFVNPSTHKNHERYCKMNPNCKLSICPICKAKVKPGSMTFHKKSRHGYVPKPRGYAANSPVLAIIEANKSGCKEVAQQIALKMEEEDSDFTDSFAKLEVSSSSDMEKNSSKEDIFLDFFFSSSESE